MFPAIPLVFLTGDCKLESIQPTACLDTAIDMKRVIRHTRTGEFFNAGAWTPHETLAQHFPDIRDLLTVCAQYHLKDVELVLPLGVESPGPYPIRVPLPPSD